MTTGKPEGEPISDIETAILGLLDERSYYGYELEKVIEVRGMRYWTEVGFSSIYYVLKRLEKKGMVQGGVKPGRAGKPARRMYTITARGRETMREKVASLLCAYRRVVCPFDLGIMFSGVLPEGEVRRCLARYAETLDKRLHFIGERTRHWRKEGGLVGPLAVMRFSRQGALVRAERAWIRTILRTAPAMPRAAG